LHSFGCEAFDVAVKNTGISTCALAQHAFAAFGTRSQIILRQHFDVDDADVSAHLPFPLLPGKCYEA
jgi:hypothetical protein